MDLVEYSKDFLFIYEKMLSKTPIASLSDTAKVQVIGHLLEQANNAMRICKEIELLDAQAEEVLASKGLKVQQKTSMVVEDGIKTEQSAKDIALKTAQAEEVLASKGLKVRQTSAHEDAIKRDTAKIVCEALSIIKSGGNNAGTWWTVASKSINNLSGDDTLANVISDPA